MSVLRVSAGYVRWAHEPAAEDGNPAAEALCRRYDAHGGKRGRLTIPLSAQDEIAELRSVAEIWAIAEPDSDRAMCREARYVLRQLKELRR